MYARIWYMGIPTVHTHIFVPRYDACLRCGELIFISQFGLYFGLHAKNRRTKKLRCVLFKFNQNNRATFPSTKHVYVEVRFFYLAKPVCYSFGMAR